ncbi:MAG: polyribonucleotide nucleotidyltransferase [Nitrospirae bacterium]|nr:polyribonucleotide nucleotidyltransferase [Nitrospirota bacterium]
MKSVIKKCSKRFISGILSMAILLEVVSCGTILYPERQGQKSGQIDIAVAALDAVGLLFFIIPGVVAFAVDFNNGAIYMPSGQRRHLKIEGKALNPEQGAGEEIIKVKLEILNRESIQRTVAQQTGHQIRLDDHNLIVMKMDSGADIGRELSRLSSQNDKTMFVKK